MNAVVQRKATAQEEDSHRTDQCPNKAVSAVPVRLVFIRFSFGFLDANRQKRLVEYIGKRMDAFGQAWRQSR